MTPATIFEDLRGILRNFAGREYSAAIVSDTRLFAELGLASIEAIVLGETLEAHYGKRLPFNQLLADIAATGERDLRVGQLVDFLCRALNSPE